MNGLLPLVAIIVIALFILTELIASAVPVLIVAPMVPPEERHGLAELVAAADSRRRLRLWRALRVAVMARRAAAAAHDR
jgi:hypothetical protein